MCREIRPLFGSIPRGTCTGAATSLLATDRNSRPNKFETTNSHMEFARKSKEGRQL